MTYSNPALVPLEGGSSGGGASTAGGAGGGAVQLSVGRRLRLETGAIVEASGVGGRGAHSTNSDAGGGGGGSGGAILIEAPVFEHHGVIGANGGAGGAGSGGGSNGGDSGESGEAILPGANGGLVRGNTSFAFGGQGSDALGVTSDGGPGGGGRGYTGGGGGGGAGRIRINTATVFSEPPLGVFPSFLSGLATFGTLSICP